MDMTPLDPVNYKNGPKNNWRRTVWNVVHDCTRNIADALVLYLPGAANLDREIAIRHGVKEGNLIAIERDPKVADYIRKHWRQTVITGDLYTVMRAWPPASRPAVVLADMVTGFDTDAWAIMGTWTAAEAFRNSVIVFNVMRGRETNEALKVLRSRTTGTVERHFGVPSTHRGIVMWNAFVCTQLLVYCPYTKEQLSRPGSTIGYEWLNAFLDDGRVREWYWWEWLPSYKSGKALYFDSMVFRDRGKSPRGSPVSNEQLEPQEQEMRRKITAALAVRTMRLRGDFQ